MRFFHCFRFYTNYNNAVNDNHFQLKERRKGAISVKKHREKRNILWGGSFLLLLMLILSACSSNGNASDVKENEKTAQSDVQAEESETTVQYTTITGEQVEIPAHPKRVVYIGQTTGDFLAMDIPLLVIIFLKILLVTMEINLKASLILEILLA